MINRLGGGFKMFSPKTGSDRRFLSISATSALAGGTSKLTEGNEMFWVPQHQKHKTSVLLPPAAAADSQVFPLLKVYYSPGTRADAAPVSTRLHSSSDLDYKLKKPTNGCSIRSTCAFQREINLDNVQQMKGEEQEEHGQLRNID